MLLEELNSLEINDKLNIVPMLSTESTISKNGFICLRKKCKNHSHIAIVVTPPSLKSFANQKKLVKSLIGHTEMITSDLQRDFPYDHSVI